MTITTQMSLEDVHRKMEALETEVHKRIVGMDEVLKNAVRLENPAVLEEPLEYPLEEIFDVQTVEHPAGVN